jgi:hypothetical protein
MDAAGRTATPPGRSPSPFATTAPDPNPASVPGVERILAGLLAASRIGPQQPSPAAGVAVTEGV